MRRSLTLVISILFVIAVALSSVLLEPVNDAFNEWFEYKGLSTFWGLASVILVVVLLAVGCFCWQRSLSQIDGATSHEPTVLWRRRLTERIFEFAEAHFDGGLYRHARNEFQLIEWHLQMGRADDRPDIVMIEPYYRGLKEPLIILGEPGTGKTTLLYELATLLQTTVDHEPIPVPFELPSWTAQSLPLEEWMTSELNRTYGVSVKLAKRWVDNEVVLPMLDGLDEVPSFHRAACVERINDYRRAHPSVKFVITCRESEYNKLAVYIEACSLLVVKTLTRAEVTAYLHRNAAQFDGVRLALEAEPALWDLMATPLMLWVSAFAFEGLSAEAGAQIHSIRDVISLRTALFDRYIDKLFQRGNEKRSYDPGRTFSLVETRRWLSRTAACMTRAGVLAFHLEDLSHAWLPEKQRRATSRLMGVALSLTIALVAAPTSMMLSLMHSGQGSRLRFFFFVVLGPMIVGLRIYTAVRDAKPVDAVAWSWVRARPSLKFVLFRLLLPALFGGLLAGLYRGELLPGYSLIVPIAILGFGVGLVLERGLVPETVQERNTVNGGLKRSASYAFFYGMAVLIPALLSALVVFHFRFDGELRDVLPLISSGLISSSLVVALSKGGFFCLKNFIMRWTLARGGQIPWRYEAFLDFAVQRDLLIRQGGSFRFVHRMVQEHLATQATSPQ